MSNIEVFKRQFVAWLNYREISEMRYEFVNIAGITGDEDFIGGIFITDPSNGYFLSDFDEKELFKLAEKHGMEAHIDCGMGGDGDYDLFVFLQPLCVGV